MSKPSNISDEVWVRLTPHGERVWAAKWESTARTMGNHQNPSPESRQVLIQVMAPESVRRQLAIISVAQGESIRTAALRALGGIVISTRSARLLNRGRRRGKTDGAL